MGFGCDVGGGSSPPQQTMLFRAISKTNQPIDSISGGTIVLHEVVKENVGFVYDEVNGELTFSNAGIYSIFISYNLDITSGFAASLEMWSEIFNGVGWEPLEDSGKLVEFDSINEFSSIFKTTATVPANTTLRFKIRSTGGTNRLGTFILSNGVECPSTNLSIHTV